MSKKKKSEPKPTTSTTDPRESEAQSETSPERMQELRDQANAISRETQTL